MESFVFPADLTARLQAAAESFWSTRNSQISRNKEIGTQDQGNRGAVTGGKQMDGFVRLIREILLLKGVPERCVFTDSCLELPGFYRPNKKWDLLVVDRDRLILVIEFKSQTGPSFGNNFNNRTEEAMGSALDLWTAYREGVFGVHRPWLGYFMVLEDCPETRRPIRAAAPHFPVLPEFERASYQERYEVFCRKLLLERQYDGACLITTSFDGRKAHFREQADDLSAFDFIRAMAATAAASFDGETRP